MPVHCNFFDILLTTPSFTGMVIKTFTTMKKVILCIVAICFIFPSLTNAQTEKGKMLVGVSSRIGLGLNVVGTGPDFMSFGFANIKYKSDNNEDPESDKITAFNLSPRYGYFLVNNFVAGLDLNLSRWSEKYGDSKHKDTYTIFSAGPFVRYYFPTKKVKPFLEGYSYFGIAKYNEEGYDENWDSKMSNNTYGGGLGVALPIGNKASFDIMLGYNSNTMKNKKDNEDNDRIVVGAFGMRFSFVFFLGKTKE